MPRTSQRRVIVYLIRVRVLHVLYVGHKDTLVITTKKAKTQLYNLFLIAFFIGDDTS